MANLVNSNDNEITKTGDNIEINLTTKHSVINNLTTSSAGNGVLDAYQGKIVNDKITNLIGVSLYDVDAGTTGTVTLSDSAANYNWLEIYFFNSDNDYNFVKVYKPNGKTVSLTAGAFFGTQMYVKSANRTISGNTISLSSGTIDTAWSIVNSTASTVASASIKIHKVVGYK